MWYFFFAFLSCSRSCSMQGKKTPAFRTKVLNMTVPRVIPEDVIEHLWVRRRQGIWDQLHPHQTHSRQPVGCSSEGETTHRGTTFHLCCFVKSFPRNCCSCSKWQHSSGSSFQQHFTFCLRDTDVCSLFQNTPMPQAFHNLWRMGQI